MHAVSWETNKTRFLKYTSPQIGENQNCPTWVRSPLRETCWVIPHEIILSRLLLKIRITIFLLINRFFLPLI